MEKINLRCRNATGPSPYFQGNYQRYCNEDGYQWNVKLRGIDFDESEFESIVWYCLGEHTKLKNGSYGFERINELLGYEVESGLEGRSGGWLVINHDLNPHEIVKVDEFVKECIKGIPAYLKSERDLKAAELKAAIKEEKRVMKELRNDPRIKKALELITKVAGENASVIVRGIKLK